MSYGEAAVTTVGFVVANESGMCAGERETGEAWFSREPAMVYATLPEALQALGGRVKRLGYVDEGITILRVVERTVTTTERSYEAL